MFPWQVLLLAPVLRTQRAQIPLGLGAMEQACHFSMAKNCSSTGSIILRQSLSFRQALALSSARTKHVSTYDAEGWAHSPSSNDIDLKSWKILEDMQTSPAQPSPPHYPGSAAIGLSSQENRPISKTELKRDVH